jgi:hypothetical protein
VSGRTPDDLRRRLQAVIDAAPRAVEQTQCPMCHGTGIASKGRKSVTQQTVAQDLGISRVSVASFLTGRQGLTMDKTLALLDWIEEREPEARP